MPNKAKTINSSQLRRSLHSVLHEVDGSTTEFVVLVSDIPRAVLVDFQQYAELKFQLARRQHSRLGSIQ